MLVLKPGRYFVLQPPIEIASLQLPSETRSRMSHLASLNHLALLNQLISGLY